MGFRIFVDANILLDLTLQRENYRTSKQLMNMVIEGKLQAFISPAIVHITGYWLTKSLDAQQAKVILLTLIDDIRVIDIPHDATVAALHSNINDIEDALQYYTAIHHKLDYFITLDKKLINKAIPSLPIYSPEDFLKKML